MTAEEYDDLYRGMVFQQVFNTAKRLGWTDTRAKDLAECAVRQRDATLRSLGLKPTLPYSEQEDTQ